MTRLKLAVASIATLLLASTLAGFLNLWRFKELWLGDAVFLVTILADVAAFLALVLFFMRNVREPIERISGMAQRVIEGDLTARVGIRPAGKMGLLCQAIDRMAEAVALREEQLKQTTRQNIGRTEKMVSIGRLAAGVAHEINNPLTTVLTFASLLREKPDRDQQEKEDLDLIIHETTRAAEIVRGLLDFSRERATVKEPLEINDVIQRTVRLIRNQKSFDHIVIEEQLAPGLPLVNGNLNQLQQVLLNLSLNACEAMPKGGTLRIASSARDGNVTVSLTDTGAGIKAELLDRIFEPFFTTKPVGKGTGLGLSVSDGIVQQHGGTLEVQSREGQGSTFVIALPQLRENHS
jgi:two-component system NtrC family sensor kinase